jgi:hypothetical protein
MFRIVLQDEPNRSRIQRAPPPDPGGSNYRPMSHRERRTVLPASASNESPATAFTTGPDDSVSESRFLVERNVGGRG